MPLIKLNRINKGGEIVINSDHIIYIEIESRVTTLHMLNNLLFSVVEPLDEISKYIDAREAEAISRGIVDSGMGNKPQ